MTFIATLSGGNGFIGNALIMLNKLSSHINFNFFFKKKNKMELGIIREEILNNIPKHKANQNDLYINIRSGDIFVNKINKKYSQPPLCFYQKIINENNFRKIYVVSNGRENPVVNELLNFYPKIKYFHGKIEEDISLIIYAFNLVMFVSTFTINLIWLNKNLKNLYIYEIINYNLNKVNYTIHKMKPSSKYAIMMKGKWKNTKEQLD